VGEGMAHGFNSVGVMGCRNDNLVSGAVVSQAAHDSIILRAVWISVDSPRPGAQSAALSVIS
jgi:hypothetical protein